MATVTHNIKTTVFIDLCKPLAHAVMFLTIFWFKTSAAKPNARKNAMSCSVPCMWCPRALATPALAMPSMQCNAIQCNTIQYRPATQGWGSHAINAMQCNTMQLTTIYPRVQKAKLTTNIPKSAEGQSHNNTPKTAEGQAHIILPIHNRRNRTPKSEKPTKK